MIRAGASPSVFHLLPRHLFDAPELGNAAGGQLGADRWSPSTTTSFPFLFVYHANTSLYKNNTTAVFRSPSFPHFFFLLVKVCTSEPI